jgi:LytS/YehU family sensor histidine kinase
VIVHGVASVCAAVGHAAVTAGFAVLVLAPGGQLRDPSFLAQFQPLAEGYLLLEIFVYWMILGVTQTVVFHRRFVAARIGRAEAEARAARSESRAAEARLQALRMEIDPHFLFNAMNAVSGLVRTGDTRGATDMLARIGGLLRVTLTYGREGSVSLQREIELVREYLGIESVRFGERLKVQFDVEPEVLDVAVPPLILQPLVENAIRHGVAPVPGDAWVRIRAYREGAGVRIDVLDSGPGPADTARMGTGLSNVSARVEEEYRGAGSFEIASDPGGGGRATLRLPCMPHGILSALPGAGR